MATLAFGLVGAGIGAATGITGTFLGMSATAIGWQIGTIIGGLIFQPKGQTVEGPRLQDLRVQTASYGEPIVDIYGTIGVSGNVIWAKTIEEVRTSKSTGGKGLFGGGGGSQVSYTYFGHFAVGFSTTVTGVIRLWADAKLIYDKSASNSGPVTKFDSNITIYLGDETQLPDPSIEADKGVGNVPAHRGMCYIVFNRLPLEDFGNHVPNITAELTNNTSDAFPFVEIPLSDNDNGPDALFIATNNHRLGWSQFTASKMLKIDYVGNVQLQVIPLEVGSDGRGIVDRNGDIYMYNGGSTIAKYEAPGYARVGVSLTYSHGEGPTQMMQVTEVAGRPIVFEQTKKSNGQAGKVNVFNGTPTLDGKMAVIGQVNLFDYMGGSSWVSPHNDGSLWAGGATSPISPQEQIFIRINEEAQVVETIITNDLDEDIRGFFYDETTDSFVGVIAGKYAWRVGRDGLLKAQSTTVSPFAQTKRHWGLHYAGSYDGFIYIHKTNSHIGKLRISDLVEVESFNPNDWIGEAITQFDTIYSPVDDAIVIKIGGEILKIFLHRGEGGSVTLKSIVDDRIDKADIDLSTETNTTALTPIDVQGYAVTARMPGRATINPLNLAFRWDLIESDFVLKAVRRGGASIATITRADLSAVEDDGEPPPFVTQPRVMEVDLIKRMDLKYIDKASDYEVGLQFAQRIQEAVNTIKQVTVDIPVVMLADEAKQTAEISLFSSWQERDAFEIFTGPKWLKLDPADVVTLQDDEFTRNVLIKQSEYGNNGIVRLNSLADDDEIYQSTAVGDEIEGDTDQNINFPALTTFALIDSPLMQDSDNNPGFYILAGASVDSWTGSVIYRSTDSIDFSPFIAVLSERNAQFGAATDILADGITTVFDEINTINILLFRGSLENKTQLEVLNGANAAILGNEIFQFKNAVQENDGSWTLSGLLRGRRGTEHETINHSIGDTFILLESGKISRPDPGLNEIGLERFYRAVTIGDIFEDFSSDKIFTNTGKGLMPYSGVNITGSRDGPGNLIIDWNRRTRTGGGWRDLVDVSLGEQSEAYEIDIIDNSGSPGIVVRTILVTTTTASYTIAEQIFDFGSNPPGLIDIEIYQISEDVGRGFAGVATI